MINLKNTRLIQRHVNSFLLGQYLKVVPTIRDGPRLGEFFLTPAPDKSLAAGFKSFIENNQASLLKATERILPAESELDKIDTLHQSWRNLFSDDNDCVYNRGIKEPIEMYEYQIKDLNRRLTSTSGAERRTIVEALDSVERLVNQIREQRLIDFLSGFHWLPSYAFPQDVVKLVVRQMRWTERMRLERDREIGIAEYAPGAEIIADGKLFKSRGVIRRGQTFVIRKYSYCPRCRRLQTGMETESLAGVCACGDNIRPYKYIEPEGFQTNYKDPVPEPNLHRVRPPSNTEIFLIAGVDPEQFEPHPAIAGITFGYRKDGRLFRANPGYRFQQFWICKSCGVQIEPSKKSGNAHETPWGTKCNGKPFQTHLAHEFETDTLQLRFAKTLLTPPDVTDSTFWLSLQTAFIAAAADVVGIPRSDLDGTYRSQSNDSLEGELIIYDRVPGGAGYVEQIIQHLPRIMHRTYEWTRNCDNPLCDQDGSCYTCLRSYRNQFHWDRLSRRPVFEWLEKSILK